MSHPTRYCESCAATEAELARVRKQRDEAVGALKEIVETCPKPRLPYGMKVNEIARTTIANIERAP